MKVTAKKKLFKRGSTKDSEQGLSLQNQPLLSQPSATTGVTKRVAMVVVVAFSVLSSVYFLHPWAEYDTSATNTAITSTVNYGDYYLSLASGSEISIDLDVTATGNYAYASDDLVVQTNIPTGYDLYLTSSDNTSSALTTSSSDTVIAATSGTGGNTGTPTTLTENSYGYALPSSLIGNNNFDSSYTAPTSSSKWAKVPAGSSDLIRSTHVANETGDNIDVHYGVYANNALASGTYTGSVVYTALATPPTAGATTITPATSAEAGSTVTITSGPLVANSTVLDNSEVIISFQQNGTTKGTCNVSNIDATSGQLVTTCTIPNTLTAGSYDITISVPRYNYNDSVATGYQVTLPPPTLKRVTAEAGITTMQGLTSSVCSTATVWQTGEEDVILTDPRDNSTYVVRKLADGNCWMVENLKLSAESLTANGHSTTLDSTDTDLTSGTFTVPATSNTNWGGSSYAVAPKIATSAQSGYTDYGMYYNWWAATARTTNITTAGAVAPDSICPKGWNLPTGNTNNQWYKLFDAYKSTYGWTDIDGVYVNNMSKVNTTNNPANDTVGPNLQFSGNWYYSSTAPYGQSSGGTWWSSTVYNETSSYSEGVYSRGFVYGSVSNEKRYGFSVRCMFPAGS